MVGMLLDEMLAHYIANQPNVSASSKERLTDSSVRARLQHVGQMFQSCAGNFFAMAESANPPLHFRC